MDYFKKRNVAYHPKLEVKIVWTRRGITHYLTLIGPPIKRVNW